MKNLLLLGIIYLLMMVGIVGMQLYNLGYSYGRIAGFEEGVSWLAPRMAHVEWEPSE